MLVSGRVVVPVVFFFFEATITSNQSDFIMETNG